MLLLHSGSVVVQQSILLVFYLIILAMNQMTTVYYCQAHVANKPQVILSTSAALWSFVLASFSLMFWLDNHLHFTSLMAILQISFLIDPHSFQVPSVEFP